MRFFATLSLMWPRRLFKCQKQWRQSEKRPKKVVRFVLKLCLTAVPLSIILPPRVLHCIVRSLDAGVQRIFACDDPVRPLLLVADPAELVIALCTLLLNCALFNGGSFIHSECRSRSTGRHQHCGHQVAADNAAGTIKLE